MKNSAHSGIDRGALKIIAAVTMLVDHIGAILFPHTMILRIIGRIAFPVFAFMIAEGCAHTKNKSKYLRSILLFGILTHIIKMYFGDNFRLNIMFTFALSVVMIYAFQYALESYEYNKSQSRKIYSSLLFAVSVALVCIINQMVDIDYGFAGCITPLIVFMGGMVRTGCINANRVKAVFLALALSLVYIPLGGVQIYSFAAVALMWFYNGDRGGAVPKYFFYVFYPAHLAVLYVIKMFM